MKQTSSYDELLSAVRAALLNTPGALSAAERLAIVNGRPPGGVLGDYVTAVREQAYRVTDDQVSALAVAGFSDDAVFEATVSAALGAALWRLDKVQAAVEAADAAS